VRAAVDLDDVVRTFFLRIQRGLPGLRDDERFGPWVYQVARSAIADDPARYRMVAAGPAS
jgi:RNA polymerase sigma-70 factor (ECF subfamily)